jgi:hypothetical protein
MVKTYLKIHNWNLSNSISIQSFWLKENYRIWISYGRQKKAFSLNTISWDNNLQAWGVRVIPFWALRVVMATMADGTIWGSDCQTTNMACAA